MKRFGLLLTILLALNLANAQMIQVYNIKDGPMEGVFRLTQKSPYSEAFLDCNSFFHGLELDQSFFYLDHQECYDIYDAIKKWSQTNALSCLEVDFQARTWNLQKKYGSCL